MVAASTIFTASPTVRLAVKAAEEESFLNMSLFNVEVRCYNYTGEIRWLNITSTPHIHPDGRIVWDGFHFDITEHKNAEAKIKESEEKYRQIVETAQEGVWLIDENSNTTFVNEHMAKMLGYTTKEVEGKHLFEFMDDEAKEIAIENIEPFMCAALSSTFSSCFSRSFHIFSICIRSFIMLCFMAIKPSTMASTCPLNSLPVK